MACEVCQHCNTTVKSGEGAIHHGRSYHRKCYKCYVCSETNLRNAEIFKGVIFCKNCSHRIFEDLSSTRKKVRPKRNRNENRVIEMAQNITSSSEKSREDSKLSRENTPMNIRTINTDTKVNLKKSSNEQGTTTLVNGEILKNLQLPERFDMNTRSKPTKKQKRYKHKKSKNVCSDLRIAELGKSTEIAQMILRKSAMPVIIKSDSPQMNFIAKRSKSLCITDGSDTSGELPLSSFDSENSKQLKTHWMDRRLRSIIKLPYISFKKKILARSSLVSVVMSHERTTCLFNKIRRTFNEEITEHQRRGLKKLFSTINKRKTQNKLGWLEKKKIKNGVEKRNNSSDTKSCESKRCRHFYNCHSYRCMRARVMRRAGPTDSQLRIIRQKIKRFILHDFAKGTLDSGKKYIELIVSQALKQECIQ